MTRLIALYPRTWRDRYEDEFLALLNERAPDPLDRLDIVRGAIDARIHPQVKGSPVAPEPPVVLGPWPARAGWLTLLGGVLWLAAFLVVVNSPMIVDQWGTYRDTTTAVPLFFGAVMLLGVGMIAVVLQLPTAARAARAATYIGSMAGLLWALAPWFLWAGAVAFGGLLVVAVAAWRAGRWSSVELGILAAGICTGWLPILAFMVGAWRPSAADPDLQFLILGSLVSVWLVVGASLVRAPRPHAAPPPTVA